MFWFSDWFRRLYDISGINYVFLYEEYEWNRLVTGFLTTIKLAAACLACSLIIGLIGAWLQGSRLKLIKAVIQGYIQLFRNTPPLVQLFFFYFVLGPLTPSHDVGGYQEALIGNFGWAVISISFFAGAFNIEIFRAGIEAVPKATVEAAESLGYTRLQAYLHVVLPLGFRISLPALSNNLVNLVKTTTLAYAIAVPEMMYAANQIWSDNINVMEMMSVLFAVYITLVGIVVWVSHLCERALRVPGVGAA
jgi:polar amino acid transport system permease protein